MKDQALLAGIQGQVNSLFRNGIPEVGKVLESVCLFLKIQQGTMYFRDLKKPDMVRLLAHFPVNLAGSIPKKFPWRESPFVDLMEKGKLYERGKAAPLFSMNPHVALPLFAGEFICGFLAIEKKSENILFPRDFDPELLISIGVYLGNVVGLLLENQGLREKLDHLSGELQSARKENQKLNNSLTYLDRESDDLYFEKRVIAKELSIAKEIQEKFFPREKLITPNISVYGTSQTASAVGGDFFDYFTTPQGWVVVLIGDVAGHGIPAAMVVAMVRGLVTFFSTAFNPATVQCAIDQVLLRFFKKKRMMTGFFAVFSPQFKKIVASNAGHLYPYRIREGRISALEFPSFPMGVVSKARFTTSEIELRQGDLFVLYSDGLVEALDTQGNQVGFSRLEKVLLQGADDEPEAMEQRIRSWHSKVTGRKPLEDDVSLVVVRVERI
jgi:sigma-B regulation protein RsbU (phosphoserine phosphatase)